jgi:homocysteine S-methyltransferase
VGAPMLNDSGLETWLVFHKGIDLPDFAAFPLLHDEVGRAAMTDYFRDHVLVAERAGTPIVLETPTWRASRHWGARLGYDVSALDRVNQEAVAYLRGIGEEAEVEVLVSGCVGPQGDGYDPARQLAPDEAQDYHRAQIHSFVAAGADRVSMYTATHAGESIGVIRAAAEAEIDVVVSFTVETDGRLPSGQPLHEAIAEVDEATDSRALYFGVNCAHPDHFADALTVDPMATARIGLLKANASRASHAELDEAETLDDGDPEELGAQFAELFRAHPHLQVLGGCCGTDVRHIDAIATACISPT